MIDRMSTSARVEIRHDSDIVVARRRARELALAQGLSTAAAEALATAVTEIASNIVVHAQWGEIFIAATDQPKRGVTVVARDTGPGIHHVSQALQDGFSTGRGLGFGLSGAQRLVDEFEIESVPGHGTVVTLKKWASS